MRLRRPGALAAVTVCLAASVPYVLLSPEDLRAKVHALLAPLGGTGADFW